MQISPAAIEAVLFFSVDHEQEEGVIHFPFEAVFMYLNSISMFLFCLCL